MRFQKKTTNTSDSADEFQMFPEDLRNSCTSFVGLLRQVER
jgi:hypothetical protein